MVFIVWQYILKHIKTTCLTLQFDVCSDHVLAAYMTRMYGLIS